MRYLFRAITAAVYLFLLAPIIFLAVSSLSVSSLMSFPPDGLTLAWYGRIQPDYIDAAFLSLKVAVVVALLSAVLGTGLALAIARERGPLISILDTIAAAPLSVPSIVIGVSLYQAAIILWDYSGLEVAGTFWGIVIGHTVIGIPFCVRAITTSHAFYERTIEEAALNLGASRSYTFRKVTLPILMPGIVSGGFLAFLASFDDVPIALFMGGGQGSTTLPLKILGAMEFSLQPDIMALAMMIVIVSLMCMLIIHRVVGLERFFGGK